MLLDAQDGKRRSGPSPTSLASSVALHTLLVSWMFFGPSVSGKPPAPPKNIYQQLIEPNEKKLVWYNFRDKLPQVSPLERHGISRPPRTDRKAEKQTIVSNSRRAGKSKQMVYLPAPPREIDKEVEAPNLFAFTVPKLPPPEPKPAARLFAPPPEVMKEITPPPPLPDAPELAETRTKLDLPQPDALPKPPAKEFVPPAETRRAAAPEPRVPDAPTVAANSVKPGMPQRRFAPPPEQKRAARPDPTVPDAPRVAPTAAKLNLPNPNPLPKPQPKPFVPPPERKRAARPDPTVPDAPAVAANSAQPAIPQRRFVPPPERKRAARPDPTVPDAPKVLPASAKLSLPNPDPLPKPQPKPFVPPPERKRAARPDPTVPDAPSVAANAAKPSMPQRRFIPPPERRRAARPDTAVPDAPAVGPASAKLTLPNPDALPKPQPRAFVAPAAPKRAPAPDPTVPDAPAIAAGSVRPSMPPRQFVPPAERKSGARPDPTVPDAPPVGTSTAKLDLPNANALPKPAPRAFHAPDSKPSPSVAAIPEIETAPAIDAQAEAGNLTAAIVGLKPADRLDRLPDAAQTARFSSGPKRKEEGGAGEPVETARIFVPDLMIRDGSIAEPDATLIKKVVKAAAAPTSRENVAEAGRFTVPIMRPEARLPGVEQVPNAPDPRFSGRNIYMVAIQMPNVTSYIGSWTMWFADHEPMPGNVHEMRPPVPTRKVDPKYVASAAAERVEGKVQLSAVIRRDGRVESVSVLQHLDDRLDFAAVQALQKWEFVPAKRDGHTVDVDAIFEIPFRLEPLAVK